MTVTEHDRGAWEDSSGRGAWVSGVSSFGSMRRLGDNPSPHFEVYSACHLVT